MFVTNTGGRAWLALALTMLPTAGTLAHGFAGSRFFPATITIDDPFVADELSLPTVSNQKTGTDPSVVETAISSELSKRITSDLGFSIGYAWTHLDQAGPPHNPNGFQNLEVTPRYQFLLKCAARGGCLGRSNHRGRGHRRKAGRGGTLCDLYPYFIFREGSGRSAGIVKLGAPVRGHRYFWLQHYIQQENHEPGHRSRHRVHHACGRPFLECAQLRNRD